MAKGSQPTSLCERASQRRRALACFILVCLCAAPARAQEGTAPAVILAPIPEPPDSWGQVRAGSFVFTPKISLAQIGVETNVFSDPENPQADFTATVVPRGELFFGTPTFRLRATVGSNLVMYAKHRSLAGLSPLTKLEWTQKLGSRLLFYGEQDLGFLRGRPNEEVDARVSRRGFGARAGLQLTPSHRAVVRVEGNYGETSYGDAVYRGVELRDTLDYSSAGIDVTVAYRLTPYTAVTTGGALTNYRFPNSPERNGLMRTSYVGISLASRALISGSASIGYGDFSSKSSLTPDHNGPIAAVGLGARLSETTAISVGASRDLKFSYSPSAPYYVSTLYEASATQRFLRYFDLVAGVQQYDLDYPNSIPGAEALDQVVRVYTGSSGIHVKGVRVGVLWSQYDRLGTGGSRRDVWSMTVTAGRFDINSRGIFMGGFGQ